MENPFQKNFGAVQDNQFVKGRFFKLLSFEAIGFTAKNLYASAEVGKEVQMYLCVSYVLQCPVEKTDIIMLNQNHRYGKNNILWPAS